MILICENCDKNYKTKWHLNRHKNKKIPCLPTKNAEDFQKSQKKNDDSHHFLTIFNDDCHHFLEKNVKNNSQNGDNRCTKNHKKSQKNVTFFHDGDITQNDGEIESPKNVQNVQKSQKNVKNVKNVKIVKKTQTTKTEIFEKQKTTKPTNSKNSEKKQQNSKTERNTKTENPILHECIYCDRQFTYRQNKYRHMKTCMSKSNKIKELECMKKIIDELKKQNESKTLQINKISRTTLQKCKDNKNSKNSQTLQNTRRTQNKTNQNLQNKRGRRGAKNIQNIQNIQINQINQINQSNQTISININGFGNENLEQITSKDKVSILNKVYEAFPAALEKIYNIPENHNFYLPNKREKKYVKVFDGENATYQDSKDFKFRLSHKIVGYLEEWFEEHQENFKSKRYTMIQNMFKDFNNGALNERYCNEIEKYLLTYSDDIKKYLEKEIKIVRDLKKS